MSFPAEAFIRLDANQTESGTFALLRGEWIFRCQFNPEGGPRQQALWLTGEHAGKVSEVPNEVVLAIGQPYGIQIRINSPVQLSSEWRPRPGTIEVAAGGGIEFWGSKLGAPNYIYAFDRMGMHAQPADRARPMLTFGSYECWLQKDGRTVGDGPLFTVGPK